ncbi:hypothetical protein [Kutzneria sp. NPDC052558]|uniref:hypothetical protein n=1 Tax=Kutzneria sp. NPDC052558 TaxID=3364121 RepID=UPI0037CBAE48
MADLRRQYTGEADATLCSDMVCGVGSLSLDDRRLLAEELDRDAFVRPPGVDVVPPVHDHVRAVVLPDATGSTQQSLEAEVLRAVVRALHHLDHPAASASRWFPSSGGRVVRKVRPLPDGLTLHVNAGSLGPLLAELLPRITPEGVLVGMPGLRAVLHHRWVELYVLDSPANLTLANVPYRCWAAALAYAEALDPGNPLQWLGNDPLPIQPEERDAMAHHVPEPVSDSLLSAILRRCALFSAASNLAFRQTFGVLEIDWRDSPSLATVAARLVDPVAGLRGARYFVARRSGRLTIASAAEDWTVTLGRLPLGDVEPGEHPEAAWSAWNLEMARPNASWTSEITEPRRVAGAPTCLSSAVDE